MALGTVIKIKRKAGAFVGGELAPGELGLDVTNDVLYASSDGTTVFLFQTGMQELADDASPQLGGILDAQSFRLSNVGAPTATGDAATKGYVDQAVRGLDWQESVLATQTDATLDPGAAPAAGARYILTNTAALHANFGTISGVGDNDIVQWDGAAWVITYDASANEGGAVWDESANVQRVFNGTAWTTLGSGSDHGSLAGLGDDDHAQYSLIVLGTAPPSAAPPRAGAVYINTASGRVWVANGNGGAANWQQMVTPDSTDTFSNKTISASTNTIDGGTI